MSQKLDTVRVKDPQSRRAAESSEAEVRRLKATVAALEKRLAALEKK